MVGSYMNMHKQLTNYLRYAEAGNGGIGDEDPLEDAKRVASSPFQHQEDVPVEAEPQLLVPWLVRVLL